MSLSRQEPKYITPPNFLKQKVGTGGLPPDMIAKAQKMIDNSAEDFSSYTKSYVKNINSDIEKTINSQFRTHEQVTNMIYPVVQLKAHGAMFNQHLISEIAASALSFLESIHVLDDDAINVIRVHYDALLPISQNRIYGFGGAAGDVLIKELHHVCDRYYKKHDITPDE